MKDGSSANNVRYCHKCNRHYTLDEGCKCDDNKVNLLKDLNKEVDELIEGSISLRGQDWLDFAYKVLIHIETYTIPQYGDKGSDQITNWSVEECLKAVKKRLDRYGRHSRTNQQELDFLKMAHEIQLAADKFNAIPVIEEFCIWENSINNDIDFLSSCGCHFSIDAYQHNYKYCLNCGKKLQVKL